ncbi:hypothetical protein GLYMA_08G107200v4 [Glycine max]|nr:hypothetical protein GLYMA_08G107200v4 [Glycine max]KAH1050620.1 hypothetical protein GYH30_020868 [Glycine max]
MMLFLYLLVLMFQTTQMSSRAGGCSNSCHILYFW